MEVVNVCGSRFAFIIFGSPVYQLGGVRIGAVLFGGAGVSEVSLLTTGKARTLYASLGSRVVGPDDISSCLSSTSSSPVSSWGSCSVNVHGYWLIIPGLWRGTGVVGGLAKALTTLLRVV
jgi:hypothetical protein